MCLDYSRILKSSLNITVLIKNKKMLDCPQNLKKKQTRSQKEKKIITSELCYD